MVRKPEAASFCCLFPAPGLRFTGFLLTADCLLLIALVTGPLGHRATGWAEEPPGALDATPAPEHGEESAEEDAPIAVELAQGMKLLDRQISDQEVLLTNAQTDRERQLIRNHIRMLQKERRSLQSLMDKLVGPDFELMTNAREEEQERRAEQHEKAAETAIERRDE